MSSFFVTMCHIFFFLFIYFVIIVARVFFIRPPLMSLAFMCWTLFLSKHIAAVFVFIYSWYLWRIYCNLCSNSVALAFSLSTIWICSALAVRLMAFFVDFKISGLNQGIESVNKTIHKSTLLSIYHYETHPNEMCTLIFDPLVGTRYLRLLFIIFSILFLFFSVVYSVFSSVFSRHNLVLWTLCEFILNNFRAWNRFCGVQISW